MASPCPGPHLEISWALLSSNVLTGPQPLLPHRLASSLTVQALTILPSSSGAPLPTEYSAALHHQSLLPRAHPPLQSLAHCFPRLGHLPAGCPLPRHALHFPTSSAWLRLSHHPGMMLILSRSPHLPCPRVSSAVGGSPWEAGPPCPSSLLVTQRERPCFAHSSCTCLSFLLT